MFGLKHFLKLTQMLQVGKNIFRYREKDKK